MSKCECILKYVQLFLRSVHTSWKIACQFSTAEDQTANLPIFFLRTGTALDTQPCAVFTYLNRKVDPNEELPVLRYGSWSCCARSRHGRWCCLTSWPCQSFINREGARKVPNLTGLPCNMNAATLKTHWARHNLSFKHRPLRDLWRYERHRDNHKLNKLTEERAYF